MLRALLKGVSRDTDSGETSGIVVVYCEGLDCPGVPEASAGGSKVHYD